MNTTKSNATYLTDVLQTANFIRKQYGTAKFTYNSISQFFAQEGIIPIALYHLKTINLVVHEKRGLYSSNPALFTISDREMMNKVKIAVSKKNILTNSKHKLRTNSNNKITQPSFENNTQLTENIAIDFLKSKGYRVLKPVSQYEEV